MFREPLDILPLWGFFAAICALAFLALEGGYRLGEWRHARTSEEKDAPVGAMVGTILGLLAFLLAFTFSMAAIRRRRRKRPARRPGSTRSASRFRSAGKAPRAERSIWPSSAARSC